MDAAFEGLPARGRPSGPTLLEFLLGETREHCQQQPATWFGRVDTILNRDQSAACLLESLDCLQRLERAAAEAAQLVGDDALRLSGLDAPQQGAQLTVVDRLRT